MNKAFALALSATALLCSTTSLAQPATIPPEAAQATPAQAAPAPVTPMIVQAPPAGGTVLPQGTSIRLRTTSELHSQNNRTGERFDLEVAEDVMLNGMVVIPRGSPATGELTRVQRRGMWGRSGRLESRLLSVRANGVTIPIRGTVNERGDTGTAGVVASIAVLPIAGFFVTGTSAVMPAGTGFTGMTESDLPLVLPAAAPVQAPPAAQTQPATATRGN